MKILRKIFKIIGVLLAIIIAAGILWYMLDGDYINGELKHYVGYSIIRDKYAVELVSSHRSPLDLISFKSLGNGFTSVEYEFYSEDEYDYLHQRVHSFTDSPIVYYIINDSDVHFNIGAVLCFIILLVCVYVIDKKYGLKNLDIPFIISNAFWYLLHVRLLFKDKGNIEKYRNRDTVITDKIKIKPEKHGIICIRTWKVKDGHLYSTGIGQARWDTSVLIADKIPQEDNYNGVYAIRLGADYGYMDFCSNILGVVSQQGEWIEHADGVVRAEYCEILHLILSKRLKTKADKFRATYGVPVTVTSSTIKSYHQWLYSNGGISCMLHNLSILNKGAEIVDGRESYQERTDTIQKAGSGTGIRKPAGKTAGV